MARQPINWPSELSTLEVSETGANWEHVTGSASYEETGGEKPTREIDVFSGKSTVVGNPGLPSVQVQLGSYVPYEEAIRVLKDAFERSTLIRFRMTSRDDQPFFFQPESDAEVDIATTGIATFAPGGPDLRDEDAFPRGLILRHGGLGKTTLAAALPAGATSATLSAAVAGLAAGGLVQIDSEIIEVGNVTDDDAPEELVRGQLGTRDVNHNNGADVLLYPSINRRIDYRTPITRASNGTVTAQLRDIPTTAIDDQRYRLVIPQVRRPSFAAFVVNVDRASMGNQANLTAPFSFQPLSANLPDIVPVYGTNTWVS